MISEKYVVAWELGNPVLRKSVKMNRGSAGTPAEAIEKEIRVILQNRESAQQMVESMSRKLEKLSRISLDRVTR